MSSNHLANWNRYKVREVIHNYFCGHSPTCEERPIANELEWGILKTTSITWSGWDEDEHKVPPPKYWGNHNLEVNDGDVLVTKAGPRHRVGVVVHVPSTRPRLMVSGKMIALRPDQNIVLPRILASALSMHEPQIFLDHNSTGMAESQVNFNNSALLETHILIPPMKEQLTISSILDSIDNTISRIEVVVEKMQRIKSGLIHDLLTCGLDENGELRDPIRHAEQFKNTVLGWVPKDWVVGSLGEQFTLQRGYDITTAEQRPGNIPVVSSSGITSYHDTPMVHESGVVTGRKGKLGDTYYIDRPFWPHDTSLWVKNFHGNNKKFAAILLKYIRLERFDAATSVPTLNRNVVHPLIIAIPRPDEQLCIVTRLECMNKSIKEEELARIKLVSMRQGLMIDLLSGKVRIPEGLS